MGLRPASELANHGNRFPNESDEYRKARTALLAEEIELRRHIERVAEQRRALPPGGKVPEDYQFIGESGRVRLSDLFGEHDTLVTYNFMFGPKRDRPCPMCTSLLSAWDGEIPDMDHLKLYSSAGNDFNRDYFAEGPNGEDWPAMNVFTRRDGTVRHFWGGEMTAESADPGQDPRGAPDLMPLWTVLDNTPEGRGKDRYPKLGYNHQRGRHGSRRC